MGQGARTLWQQIVADELGAPLEQVSVVSGDTGTVPFDLQTSASRSTVFMGSAVLEACKDVRQRVLDLYAESTGVPAEQLDERPGVLVTPDGELALPEAARGARVAARRVHRPGHPAAARQGQAPARRRRGLLRVQRHGDRGRGRPGDRRAAATRHVTVSDVGTELNPLQVVPRTRAPRSWAWATARWSSCCSTNTAGSATSVRWTTGSPPSRTSPGTGQRGRGEPRRPGPVRLQGHQRGRAAVHRAARSAPRSPTPPAS